MNRLAIAASMAWSMAMAVAHAATPAVPATAPGSIATDEAMLGATDPLLVRAAASLKEAEIASLQQRLSDWPQLGRYRIENAALAKPSPGEHRVVFFGDSITEFWGRPPVSAFFDGKPYVNRGIAGQTTAQMVVRFRQDVIDLQPAVVVILAGTNDITGNTGVATMGMVEDNLRTMTELAKAHHIRVVLASLTPVSGYSWRPELHPAPVVRRLNAWIARYAHESGSVYLDYYSALANAEGGMDKPLAADGLHPTEAGYAIMAPLVQHAIAAALSK